jgi:hypothetical protein
MDDEDQDWPTEGDTSVNNTVVRRRKLKKKKKKKRINDITVGFENELHTLQEDFNEEETEKNMALVSSRGLKIKLENQDLEAISEADKQNRSRSEYSGNSEHNTES